MIGLLAQKGLGLFSRSSRAPSPDLSRLIEMLDILVAQCEHEADLAGQNGLMPDRYQAIARAAAEGHYPIEPERIAERLMRH